MSDISLNYTTTTNTTDILSSRNFEEFKENFIKYLISDKDNSLILSVIAFGVFLVGKWKTQYKYASSKI